VNRVIEEAAVVRKRLTREQWTRMKELLARELEVVVNRELLPEQVSSYATMFRETLEELFTKIPEIKDVKLKRALKALQTHFKAVWENVLKGWSLPVDEEGINAVLESLLRDLRPLPPSELTRETLIKKFRDALMRYLETREDFDTVAEKYAEAIKKQFAGLDSLGAREGAEWTADRGFLITGRKWQ